MAYLYKMKLQIQVYLTYRFEVYAGIITKFILIIANVFLWECVYSTETAIEGIGKEQMITYSVMSACLSLLYSCGIQGTINTDVRKGNISTRLIRPFNLLGAYFAEDVGSVLVNLILKVVPVLILCALILPIKPPVSIEAAGLMLVSYLFGFLIMWLLSALMGMFAFVTMELGNIGVVKDMVVAILSGSMIPVWFFSEQMEKVLMMTPFPYTYQTPLGLYIGKIGINEGLHQIGIQLVWVLILGMCVSVVWHKAQKKVLVQGG